MKPILVLCGILTVVATAIAQETATLEIPEPGEGGPSLRVLGDAELEQILTVKNGAKIDVTGNDGFSVTSNVPDPQDTRAASLIRIVPSAGGNIIGLHATASHTATYTYTATGIRAHGEMAGSDSGTEAYGIHTSANGADKCYGIYATSDGQGSENWAGWFDGKIKVDDELHVSKLARLERGLVIEEYGGITVEGEGIPLDINASSYAGAVFDIAAPTLGVYGIQAKANAGAGSGTGIKAVGFGPGGGRGIEAIAKGSGRNIGIWATAEDGEENWAGWFEGNTIVNQGTFSVMASSSETEVLGTNITATNTLADASVVSGLDVTAVSSAPLSFSYDWTPISYGLRATATGNNETVGIKARAEGGSRNIGVHASVENPDDENNLAGLFEGDVMINGKLKIDDWTISQVPDYVFKEDYKLRSLQEVEEYVTAKNHLPEVPSAEEITKNGLDLAEMNMVLLKKVEELTLYTIQQQKQIDELRTKLDR